MKRVVALLLACACTGAFAAEKKIILLAGSVSHGPGEHEFNAGCNLLQRCLNSVPGIRAEVYRNGWPQDTNVFTGAAAVFLYSDGGGGHPYNKPERRELINELAGRGVGIGCAHYAVEVPKGPTGDAFLQWIGGYFLTNWSVNPTWTAEFKKLPQHPITQGVQPFQIRDEWYYHMQFPEGMKGVTPILSAVAPTNTLGRSDGTHSGNPGVRAAVAKGEPQITMWATERPDGGRGFGFTGGHFHKNWGDANFRKLVLNAILWTAKAEIPRGGTECSVTEQMLTENLDPKDRKK